MEQRDAGTTTTVTARSTGVRYGFVLGIVIVAYFFILTSIGLHSNQGFWLWFKYAFIIGAIYMAHRYFKYHNGALMEYGQGVSVAVWTGLTFGLLDAVFRYIYIKFIDPSFIQKMQAVQIEEMQRKGMSETEIDQAVGITSLFVNAEFVAVVVFLSALVGAVVIGLVLSIFTRNVFTRNS
jgi:hypothetical protein